MRELHFKGKEFLHNHHLTVPHRLLVAHPDKSVGEPRLDGSLEAEKVQSDLLQAGG